MIFMTPPPQEVQSDHFLSVGMVIYESVELPSFV